MDMNIITTADWIWAIGFGIISIAALFGASESLIRGKLNAPSVVVAAFMIAFASITLSFFLACLGDFQMGSTDTLDNIHRAFREATWYLHYY